ncbi:putative protein kinase RLK-Pelle-RLCK-VIIa-2 family [Helianthus anomalus]
MTLAEIKFYRCCSKKKNKGFIDDKLRPRVVEAQPVAVKLLDLDGGQGHNEWLAEVTFLGQLRHPHLVKLIGYSISLSWLTRIKIALGAAKGLAFLHGEEKPVIYRDFKTSNILLESDYTTKLLDFGLAKDGPEGTHVSTRVMGTHSYAAPEYVMTGHLTTMSDVYSFGVVLLKLLTGRRSMDKKRPSREQCLVEWARPLLRNTAANGCEKQSYRARNYTHMGLEYFCDNSYFEPVFVMNVTYVNT